MTNLEIKFRGLRPDGSGWAYGYVCVTGGITCIMVDEFRHYQDADFENSFVDVVPETVGQFTGKKCKITGDRIFTGDIVKDYQGGIYHVVYDTHYAAFMLRSSLIYSGAQRMEGNYEKVGNIFDDTFTEPEPKGIEPPSKTPSSDSFTRRNQKESLRGIK